MLRCPTNNVVNFDGDNVQEYFGNSTLTRLILQFSSLAPSDEGASCISDSVFDVEYIIYSGCDNQRVGSIRAIY